MEYRTLARVVDELARVLPGARVDRVHQVGVANLVLSLHSRGLDTAALLVAAERPLPRLHLLSARPPVSAVSSPFFLFLKKHLAGSRISGIALLNNDRVTELRFEKRNRTYLLLFELLGMSTNLILTDAAHHILAVLRPVSPGMDVPRPLVPGIVYAPPVPMSHPSSAEVPNVLPSGPEGPPELAANRAAESMFEKEASEREQAELRRSIETALKRALARVERRCGAVQRDMDAAEHADLYRFHGELILANLSVLRRGLDHADLPGPDGDLHRVTLDPERTPADNAGRYFRRYKKAKAGIGILRERLAEAREEQRLLQSLLGRLASASDSGTLAELRRSLAARGLVRDRMERASGDRESPRPYRSVSFEGWDIVIGKSAAGNDYVTMHLARPDDLWLHAEGIPGSHVLIRNPGKRDVPPDVLAKAASLAAYFSQGRRSAKVPVAYTFARHVQKPKGASPGTVLLRERKSVMAAPRPA